MYGPLSAWGEYEVVLVIF